MTYVSYIYFLFLSLLLKTFLYHSLCLNHMLIQHVLCNYSTKTIQNASSVSLITAWYLVLPLVLCFGKLNIFAAGFPSVSFIQMRNIKRFGVMAPVGLLSVFICRLAHFRLTCNLLSVSKYFPFHWHISSRIILSPSPLSTSESTAHNKDTKRTWIKTCARSYARFSAFRGI